MRICLPIWEFHDRGGIERSVTELVRWLLEKGHAVEVLTHRNRSALAHPQLTIREMPLPKAPLSVEPRANWPPSLIFLANKMAESATPVAGQ